jgi:hypothetical protein
MVCPVEYSGSRDCFLATYSYNGKYKSLEQWSHCYYDRLQSAAVEAANYIEGWLYITVV